MNVPKANRDYNTAQHFDNDADINFFFFNEINSNSENMREFTHENSRLLGRKENGGAEKPNEDRMGSKPLQSSVRRSSIQKLSHNEHCVLF